MYKKYNQLGDEGKENAPAAYAVMEIQSSEHKHDLLRKNAIVCIDVYANWCQPCKQMEPSYAVLAKKLSIPGKCMIVKENIETGLSREFEITAVPVFLIFFRGSLHKRISGADLQPVEETLHALFSEMTTSQERPHSMNRQIPGQPNQPRVPPHQGQPSANYKQNYGVCDGAQCTYDSGSVSGSPSFNSNNNSVRQFNKNR